MKKELTFFILLSLFACQCMLASEWQWSVKIPGFISPETNENPEAFLWIPSDCKQVRAVVFGQHNMCEETIFEHPVFRKQMGDLGFAIVWLTPGIEQRWDVSNGCQTHFETMMNDLAAVSGYDELSRVPVVPVGHSAMATFPWNFAAWNPERTLAIVSYHGDAPRTNLTGYGRENLEWGRTRNINGIPGLMIIGEYEWWEARVNPASAFRMMYPESCISLLCDAGHGHFDVSDEVIDYISLFLKKSAEYRLTDGSRKLEKVDVCKGWLAERWHPTSVNRAQAASFANYTGDKHDAFWYFDEEIALVTEQFYARESGKQMRYIGFVQNGELCTFSKESHAQYNIPFHPEADGITFHLSAAFTDSLHRMPQARQKGKIHISRICGPVKEINDSTFMVDFYRMGLNNKKRTGSINLLAHNKADDVYKSSVQHLAINIPYPQTEGKKQVITFPALEDVSKDVKSIALTATSNSGLPVSYYIKEGPAEVNGNILRITKLPPRTKYPVKVTVVAWQYGRSTGDKVQTAEAMERSFHVTDDHCLTNSLNTKIASWVNRGYYDGASIKIMRDDNVCFENYFGDYTDTTTLHVASAGKWVVSAIIAAVVDEGKLSWNDKVKDYLPEFKDIKGEATLSQLLSHTAGYPDYQPKDKRPDDYQTLKEAVAHIVTLPADTLPGTKFKYGGLAMQVAGRMAEIATGEDWETIFQSRIAIPLKMQRSHFVPVSSEPGFNPMLGGGLSTCLRDYMNFLNMISHNGLFEGKRILSSEAINAIESDQVKEATFQQPEYVQRSRQNAHHSIYGLGVWREELDHSKTATMISSPGWAGSYPWVDRINNIYGFILAKVKDKAFEDGFSSFYGSAELPLIVRNNTAH